MSPGASAAAEGLAPGVPVPQGRAHVLARLEAEKRQALGCFENDRAAELGRQIADLSRPASGGNPRTETTSRARSTAARRSK